MDKTRNAELTITMPVNLLNRLMSTHKADYDKFFRNLDMHKPEGFPASAILTLVYDSGSLDELMPLLRFLYEDSGNQPLPIRFGNREYAIQDQKLHKLLSQAVATEKIPTPGGSNALIKKLIGEHHITDLAAFASLSRQPFSGLMPYDKVDFYGLFKNEAYLNGNAPMLDAFALNANSRFSLDNRYIDRDITIRTCANIRLTNCVITGTLDFSDVDEVFFFNCIITDSVRIRNSRKITINGCNANKVLICRTQREITNATEIVSINKTKIHKFTFINSDVGQFNLKNSVIVQSHMEDVRISDANFRSSQFDYSKLKPQYMDSQSTSSPKAEFYLTFQDLVDEKATSNDERTLDTIDTLLKYGDFDHDHNACADLKYKKLLYSNTGFRRIFVRFTGGYFKPSRWVCYLLAVMLAFSVLYCVIPDGFVSTINGDTFSLDFLTSLQFSLLQLIGADTMAIAGTGVCQILTIVHASLNATVIANFFAAIVKRYMTA